MGLFFIWQVDSWDLRGYSVLIATVRFWVPAHHQPERISAVDLTGTELLSNVSDHVSQGGGG